MSKAAQIRTLLAEGLDAKAVAEKAGVKVQYVHDVRYKDELKSLSQGPRRARKAKKMATVAKASIVPQVSQEQGKIDSMKKYIMHLETELLMRDGAIGALRNKLYASSV